MKIAMTGVTGFHNRGVDALVRTDIQEILKKNTRCEITVLSTTPDYDTLKLANKHVSCVKDCYRTTQGRIVQKLSPISGILKKFGGPASHAVSEYFATNLVLKNSSLVIATGGDIFSEDYSTAKTNRLSLHLAPLIYAQKHNIPVVFLGHSIGPFTTTSGRDLWLKVAKKSELITVRESLSYKYLINDLGLPKSKVVLTADTAFLLPIPESKELISILEYYGITSNVPKIALGISQGISNYAKIGYEMHLNSWCNIIKALMKNTTADIILIPHVQEMPLNDDRIIGSEIVKTFGYNKRLKLIGGEHNSIEFKGIISSCDLVVAERMHVAIAGMSSAVPTITVSYSVKGQGIMDDVYGKSQSINYTIPAHIMVDSDACIDVILNGWNNREQMKDQINKALPAIIERAALNFYYLNA